MAKFWLWLHNMNLGESVQFWNHTDSWAYKRIAELNDSYKIAANLSEKYYYNRHVSFASWTIKSVFADIFEEIFNLFVSIHQHQHKIVFEWNKERKLQTIMCKVKCSIGLSLPIIIYPFFVYSRKILLSIEKPKHNTPPSIPKLKVWPLLNVADIALYHHFLGFYIAHNVQLCIFKQFCHCFSLVWRTGIFLLSIHFTSTSF